MRRRVKAYALFVPNRQMSLVSLQQTPGHLPKMAVKPWVLASVTITYDDGRKPARKKAKR